MPPGGGWTLERLQVHRLVPLLSGVVDEAGLEGVHVVAVLAIAAARDYNLTSLDIRQAYLQATIDEDLYMRAPPGITTAAAASSCATLQHLSCAQCST